MPVAVGASGSGKSSLVSQAHPRARPRARAVAPARHPLPRCSKRWSASTGRSVRLVVDEFEAASAPASPRWIVGISLRPSPTPARTPIGKCCSCRPFAPTSSVTSRRTSSRRTCRAESCPPWRSMSAGEVRRAIMRRAGPGRASRSSPVSWTVLVDEVSGEAGGPPAAVDCAGVASGPARRVDADAWRVRADRRRSRSGRASRRVRRFAHGRHSIRDRASDLSAPRGRRRSPTCGGVAAELTPTVIWTSRAYWAALVARRLLVVDADTVEIVDEGIAP